MTKEKKEFASWWVFVLALVIFSIIAMSVLGYFGKFTSTVVEREVFEQSYQKQTGDRQRLSTYKAQLAQINSRLHSATDEEKEELQAQASMLNVQINSMRYEEKQ